MKSEWAAPNSECWSLLQNQLHRNLFFFKKKTTYESCFKLFHLTIFFPFQLAVSAFPFPEREAHNCKETNSVSSVSSQALPRINVLKSLHSLADLGISIPKIKILFSLQNSFWTSFTGAMSFCIHAVFTGQLYWYVLTILFAFPWLQSSSTCSVQSKKLNGD